tara:strand:+ start:189 stop:962 length:774 start_codon:yes stop_codon:yes gene_type:complete
MARKPQALRLTQAKETLTAYKAAGLETMSQARFLSDMIYRMGRNKYPTKRQRDWLDTIIEEGVPTPKGDQDYIAKIDEAIATQGIDFGNVLIDFRGKLVRGWDLSKKQKTWCDSLIKKAQSIRDNTFWRPDTDLTKRIKAAVDCSICYTDVYWNTHPGGARALAKAKFWLSDTSTMIDEYTVGKLLRSVAGRLREMENPKFKSGSLGYVDKSNKETGLWEAKSGLIISGPTPTRAGVVYDILVDGEIFSAGNIRKRR